MIALPYILLYLAPAIISGLLAVYIWQRRYYRSGRPFTLVLGATAFWCGAHALSIAGPTYELTLFWSLIQYAGIVLIMPAWLLLALSYSGQRWRRKRLFQFAIFLPALCFFVLVLTNNLHHLWWPTVDPDTSRGYMWLKVTRGPLFWAHSLYAYSCFAFGIGLLARSVISAGPLNRRHAWLMLIAVLIPAIGNLAFLGGVRVPWNDDPTPIFLFVGAMMVFYATVHFRVIDLAPLVEREVFAALPDGLVVVDNQGIIVELNAEAISLLGIAPGEHIGQPLLALAAASPHLAELRSILASGTPPRTHQFQHGDGDTLRALELRVRPLLAANGVMAGRLLLLRDTSERVRVEQANARHLAELSLINQVARVANTATETERLIRAIAVSIVQTGQWERVAVGLADPSATRITSVADYGARAGQSYEGSLIAGSVGVELSDLLRVGQTRFLDNDTAAGSAIGDAMGRDELQSLLVVPLYHQHEPIGVLIMGNRVAKANSLALMRVAETIGELITDAAVRTRLYEEVRTADQLKSSFLATVSHELRTPLTSMIGYVELLQKGIYGNLGERMDEPLGHMRNASGVLLRLINDILEFSRMEAGHLKVDLTPTDLRRVIANVAGQIQPQIRERGLELRLDLAADLPLVQANSTRLEQVLTNLLVNAIKFTDVGAITIGACCEHERLRIRVQDTGIGIAPEHRETIFQEFRRVEEVGRRHGGAGLGLAISRRLIALMGGTITVESMVGAGSIFFVELPIARTSHDEPTTVMMVGGPEKSVARS